MASPFDVALGDVLADGSADIACPFIGLRELDDRLASLDRWRLVTDFEAWMTILPTVKAREAALDWCARHRDHIKHLSGLHAKIVVGRQRALVGSANLTAKGLRGRTEMGVLLDERGSVEELNQWFEAIWSIASHVDDTARDYLTRCIPMTTLSVNAGGKAMRPPGMGINPVRVPPVRAMPVAPASLPTTTEDDKPIDGRFQVILKSIGDRPRAEAFLEWCRELLTVAELPIDDRRLRMVVRNDSKRLTISINHRFAFAMRGEGATKTYFMLNRNAAEALSLKHEGMVEIHESFDGGSAQRALVVTRFPPAPSFASDLRPCWHQAVRQEVADRANRSGRGETSLSFHRAVVDLSYREVLLDAAYGVKGFIQ